MRFRQHRGGLEDSMQTLVHVKDRDQLVSHCQKLMEKSDFHFEPNDLQVSLYSQLPDTRIGWEQTYIVTIKGWGPVGFTDALA